MSPYFSVIIPTFNRKELIIGCVESLLKQNISKKLFEIIVVDNNSTDGTLAALKKYPIKLFTEKKQGSYAARNKGVSKASGEWLVFTDSDCLPAKDWLEHYYKYSQGTNKAFAGEVIHLKTKTLLDDVLKRTKAVNQKKALSHPYLPYALTANASYHRTIFKKIGGFDERFSNGGDIDFSWRVQLKTRQKIKYISQAVVYHQPKENIREFLRQVVRYGQGERMLEQKYQLPSILLPRIKRVIFYGFLALPKYIYYQILKLSNSKIPYTPEIAFLDFLYNLCFLIGRLKKVNPKF